MFDYQQAKRDMCVNAVARAKVTGLKGKARENDCLSFCAGYATALINVGGPDLSAFVGLVVAMRGFAEVESVANEAGT